MIQNALKDSWVSPSHKLALSQRMEKLAKRWKLEAQLAEIPLLTAAEPKCVIITGRSLPRFKHTGNINYICVELK